MERPASTLIEIEVGRRRPYSLEITRQDVPMRNLPPALHGVTFAHVTDIHGGFAGLEKVYDAAVEQVNADAPDYVFFTGDYIDKRTSDQEYPVVDLLKRLRARRGAYGCLGNHDHRRGDQLTRRLLERAGVRLLDNENLRTEEGLWLAGVDDLHEGHPDIARTFAGLPANQTSIVLSHNPRLIEHAEDRDLLILSGHTHGAQFRLKFPTPLMICYGHLRCWQVAGWYERGRTRLYVSRGLGVTGKPYRINCPAEVGLFRLVADPAQADPGRRAEPERVPAASGR